MLSEKKSISFITEVTRKYLFGFLAVIIYGGLTFCNKPIIPDYLNISSIEPQSFFELLIGSTASVFGILIAVILLAFEFVKHKAFRRKDENILTKGVVTNLVAVAIAVIVLSLISYSTIKDFDKVNNLSKGYFLSFLFVGFIISIFPATRGILESANSLKKTKKEIDNLTWNHFNEIRNLEDNKFIAKNNNLSLIRIRHELIYAVRDCDYEAYASILEKLNDKVIFLIGDGLDRTITANVFYGITFIWKSGNFEASRVGNLQYFETVWECIDELYSYAAKNKIPLLHYERLDFFLEDLIKYSSVNKINESLTAGVNALSSIFRQHLKFNCPIQEEISTLYFIYEKGYKSKHNSDCDMQWDKIFEILYLINKIHLTAIKIVDKELFDSCRFQLEMITSEIGHGEFPNLKKYQEAWVVGEIFSQLTYAGYLAKAEKLSKDKIWPSFKINSSFISKLIKHNKIYAERILQDISDFIIKSQRIAQLDRHFTLNYWGALGRHISHYYQSNIGAQKSMEYIINANQGLKKIENE